MEYLLNITIHAVSGLKFTDPDMKETVPSPYCDVVAFDETKQTTGRTEMTSAEFDAFFSFTKTISTEEFREGDVIVTVWHTYMKGMRQMKMGSITFGMARVHGNPDHVVRKNWFPICLPEAPADAVGFVQLTLGMYGPGDSVPRQAANLVDTDNAAGAALPLSKRVVSLPSEDAKNIYQLHLGVYQASDLMEVEGTMGSACNPFVEVSFNGTSTNTTVVKDSTVPIWNEEVTVPFNYPAWDDSIGVRLVSQGTLTVPEQEIGSVSFSVEELVSHMVLPSWFNFYHAPSISELGGLSETKCAESVFCGRMLLSAKVIRTENPTVGLLSIRPPREPPIATRALWIDMYSICMGTGGVDKIFAKVVLPPFLEVELPAPEKEDGSKTWTWDAQGGRVQPKEVQVPEDPTQCADLIINIYIEEEGYLASEPTRFAYLRVPVEEILQADHEPKWRDIFNVESGDYSSNAGVLLCALSLQANPSFKMPDRKTIEQDDYVFRAIMYQAVNLPVADDQGTSDSFAAIFFGSAVLKTPIYGGALSPSWYTILEKTVHMPKSESLRPEITMIILDKDEGGESDPLAMCVYNTEGAGSLPTRWVKPPKWLELDEVPGGPLTQGKILCAFECFPEKDRHLHVRDSIGINTTTCRIEVFLIGIRIFSGEEVHSPLIEVSWGRAKDNPHLWFKPKKSRNTKIGTGGNGNYDFFDKLVIGPCALASDALYQEWLDVAVMSTAEPEGQDWDAYCSANIHLTPHIPMIPEEDRANAATKHRMKRLSEVMREEAEEERLGINGGGDDSDSGEDVRGDESKQAHLARLLGWNHTSVEGSNVMDLHDICFEYACVADEHYSDHAAATKRADLVMKEINAKRAKAGGEDADGDENRVFDGLFQWPAFVDEDDGFGEHFDIHKEVEASSSLDSEKLPYFSTPLFRGVNGIQENIGSLKFMLRIIERDRYKENGPEVQLENEAFQQKIDDFKQAYENANELQVRAYILNAEGLSPNSPSGCVTYLWSLIGDESDPTRSFKFETQIREHTLFPRFNALHNFKRCKFPECSQLKIRVMEKVKGLVPGTAPSDEILGCTSIDLEDRWFHPRFWEMVRSGVTPIEARRLRRDGSCFERGFLRLWIDIVDSAQATTMPTMILPESAAQEFELRLVIWKVSDIVTLDGGMACASVQATTSWDDGTLLEEITDQHNCVDTMATFNWRFIFQLWLPCKEPRLKFALLDVGTFSSDMLGEVTLDFTMDYYEAATSGAEVILPRGKLKLFHLAYPGQVRGILDMEGKLLNKMEANQRRVGKAREDPNEDPFLDPEDPHLLKGREGMLDAIANVAAAVGNGLAMLGKFGAYYKIIMMLLTIIPSIGGAIFMIYSLTSG